MTSSDSNSSSPSSSYGISPDEKTTDDSSNQMQKLQELLHKVPGEVLEEEITQRLYREDSETSAVLAQFQYHTGPLPPPAVLNEYNQIENGFAERIVKMAEQEQLHRHKLELQAVSGEINKDSRGQIFAFILCSGLILGSIFLIANEHDVAGTILGGTSLIGLAATFMHGKRKKETEPENNPDQNAS